MSGRTSLPASRFAHRRLDSRTANSSSMHAPLSPTSPTSAKRPATGASLGHKRRRTNPAPYFGGDYQHTGSLGVDSITMLADDELDEDERDPIILRVRVPLSSRRNRTSGPHSSINSSPSSTSSSLSSMSELQNSLPSLSLGIATPPPTPPRSFITLPTSYSDDEASTSGSMDIDGETVNEKLYIRIRVPPNLRLTTRASGTS